MHVHHVLPYPNHGGDGRLKVLPQAKTLTWIHVLRLWRQNRALDKDEECSVYRSLRAVTAFRFLGGKNSLWSKSTAGLITIRIIKTSSFEAHKRYTKVMSVIYSSRSMVLFHPPTSTSTSSLSLECARSVFLIVPEPFNAIICLRSSLSRMFSLGNQIVFVAQNGSCLRPEC